MYRDARMRLAWAKADRPLIAQNRTVSQSKLMAGSGIFQPFPSHQLNDRFHQERTGKLRRDATQSGLSFRKCANAILTGVGLRTGIRMSENV
jgi:hypothetical protein